MSPALARNDGVCEEAPLFPSAPLCGRTFSYLPADRHCRLTDWLVPRQELGNRSRALSSSRNRSTRRCTFPVVVIGNASMNSISFGYS